MKYISTLALFPTPYTVKEDAGTADPAVGTLDLQSLLDDARNTNDGDDGS